MIHSLLDRLKPQFKKELDSNIGEGYDEMVHKIHTWLSETAFFDRLTIHQVHCLTTFTNQSITKINQIELMYGSHWFYTNDEYKQLLEKND